MPVSDRKQFSLTVYIELALCGLLASREGARRKNAKMPPITAGKPR